MNWRSPFVTILLAVMMLASLWLAALIAIVWAALGNCDGNAFDFFGGPACDTGAGAEALILATIGVALAASIGIAVWTVRRIRNRPARGEEASGL